MNQRLASLAEHFGLEWVNAFDAEKNPLLEIGHFVRKDGVRSANICILDCMYTDVAKKTIGPEISKLLGHEAEGSGV